MTQDTVVILFEFVALVFAFSIHECAHAWVALLCGDPTAKMLGRVTLNPIKHLDPIGSVMMPLLAAFSHFPLIGWAKPTPVSARNFARYKRDWTLVTLAGPVSNLLSAAVFLLALLLVKHWVAGGQTAVQMAFMVANRFPEVAYVQGGLLNPLALLLYCGVQINVLLFAFNLIPMPPLDGSNLLALYLSPRLTDIYKRILPFSFIIFMIFSYKGWLGIILFPPLQFFNQLLFRL